MATHVQTFADLEEALLLYPMVADRLDEAALLLLKKADVDRAVELIEEIASKGDVRNPSAFVVKALSLYPQRRGRSSDVEEVLTQNPQILASLDEDALLKLRASDPARAVEIIEEIAVKSDVRNPSAFISSALLKYPHKRSSHNSHATGSAVDEALAQNKAVTESLDQDALNKLRKADPARAVEVIEEIAAKGDVHNPSAFAVKALTTFPRKRGSPKEVEQVLARFPSILASLDDTAAQKLTEADPARAVEIIEDLAVKTDVRNPSAFVATALLKFPNRRGGQFDGHTRSGLGSFGAKVAAHVARAFKPAPVPVGRPKTLVDHLLAANPALRASLDADATAKLQEADPERAAEVIEDLASKVGVRNPSAFVSRALIQYPQRRSAQDEVPSQFSRMPGISAISKKASPALEMTAEMDDLLDQYPGAKDSLDIAALKKLQEVDLDRAVEILDDLAAKGNVRNPSAFVASALKRFPQKRGLQERSLQEPRAYRAPPGKRAKVELNDDLFPEIILGPAASTLDDEARKRLNAADPVRATEVLEELAQKGRQIRNASGFVTRALTQYPAPRGQTL